MKKILITGCAGFIGSNLIDALLTKKYVVSGVDNFNDYYDPNNKRQNISKALSNGLKLHTADILDEEMMNKIFIEEKPQAVIHLAARAGVRPSIANPILYTKTNVQGTVNVLAATLKSGCQKFIFGSSSSVYGESATIPFEENDACNKMISPYASSKRAAELTIESFHKSFDLKAVILRFFTVYGERGRPDMSPAIFTQAILNGETINIFGQNNIARDFTYIKDIVDGIIKSIETDIDFEIINLGHSDPITLGDFITQIENLTGKHATVKKLERQSGDVVKTWAKTDKALKILNWKPKVSIEQGLDNYIKWLKTCQ